MSGSGGRPLRISERGRDTLPGNPGMVRFASQMPGRGRKTLLDVREWSGGLCKCLEEVGRPTRMSGCGQEALPKVRERLGGPPGCL